MTHAAGYNSARSTVRSTDSRIRSTARSTGVHEVHRHRTVDRPIDRCREAVDHPVDRLKGAKSRLEIVDRRGQPWHGSVDQPVGRQTCFLLCFMDSDSFSGWDRIQLGFPKTQGLCGYK